MKLNWSDWLEIQSDLGEEYVERVFEGEDDDLEVWVQAEDGSESFTEEAQDEFNQITDVIEGALFEVMGDELEDDEVRRGFVDFTITAGQKKQLVKILNRELGFNVSKFLKK